ILVLVVAEDDHEVRVAVVDFLTRPPHALDELIAMLPGVRLPPVIAPLLAHGLWPGYRVAVALRQERVLHHAFDARSGVARCRQQRRRVGHTESENLCHTTSFTCCSS